MRTTLIQSALDYLDNGCFIVAKNDCNILGNLAKGTVFYWNSETMEFEIKTDVFGSDTIRKLEHLSHAFLLGFKGERSTVKILVKFPREDPIWIFAAETNA